MRATERARVTLAAMAVLGFIVGGSIVADAAGPTKCRLEKQAKAYAKQCFGADAKAALRRIPVKVGGRHVERLAVPVLAGTTENFCQAFSEKNGAVIWRKVNDPVHVPIYINGAKEGISHSTTMVGDTTNYYGANKHAGHWLALALDKKEIGGVRKFLKDYIGNKPNHTRGLWTAKHGGEQHGGCMWWLVHMQIDGKPLSHIMGVTRSRTPGNQYPKLVHAGNERVGPIGVAVQDLAQFKAMTDQDLLGAQPQGGVEDSIK